MTNEFDNMTTDEIASGLVSGSLKSSCPMTQRMVEDVKAGSIPISQLKEELAKAKLGKVA